MASPSSAAISAVAPSYPVTSPHKLLLVVLLLSHDTSNCDIGIAKRPNILKGPGPTLCDLGDDTPAYPCVTCGEGYCASAEG